MPPHSPDENHLGFEGQSFLKNDLNKIKEKYKKQHTAIEFECSHCD